MTNSPSTCELFLCTYYFYVTESLHEKAKEKIGFMLNVYEYIHAPFLKTFRVTVSSSQSGNFIFQPSGQNILSPSKIKG